VRAVYFLLKFCGGFNRQIKAKRPTRVFLLSSISTVYTCRYTRLQNIIFYYNIIRRTDLFTRVGNHDILWVSIIKTHRPTRYRRRVSCSGRNYGGGGGFGCRISPSPHDFFKNRQTIFEYLFITISIIIYRYYRYCR